MNSHPSPPADPPSPPDEPRRTDEAAQPDSSEGVAQPSGPAAPESAPSDPAGRPPAEPAGAAGDDEGASPQQQQRPPKPPDAAADGQTDEAGTAEPLEQTASPEDAADQQETDEAEAAEPLEDAAPLEEVTEDEGPPEKQWYILKVQVNREESIRDALARRVKIAGLESYFGDIIVPTEDVAEFNRAGKRRIVKRKLYPGYIMVNMAINDDTWFLVRETPGIGDFTGSAGKPTPMADHEVARILSAAKETEPGETPIKTAIPFKRGDRVRVKEGYFLNFEGDIESVDEANGRVTVMINIFGRSTPVELEHWQVEAV